MGSSLGWGMLRDTGRMLQGVGRIVMKQFDPEDEKTEESKQGSNAITVLNFWG